VRLRPLIEHTKLVFDVYKRRKTATDQDRRPALANVKVPTLVIAGELDTLNGPLPASWFASAMPQATIVIVPGAGHLVHLEQPEAFDRAIETFAKTLH
jgi:pimeloyl-ACP methyl ester carboxylesterase